MNVFKYDFFFFLEKWDSSNDGDLGEFYYS